MRALEFITGHVIYNPAYTYKFPTQNHHVQCTYGDKKYLVNNVCNSEKSHSIVEGKVFA